MVDQIWHFARRFVFVLCIFFIAAIAAGVGLPVSAGTPISYGDYVNGTISTAGIWDTYTFSATSGDPVYIRLHTSWPYSGQVKLYAPNGTLLASPEGYYGTTLTKTLPDTGTYTLLAGDVDGGDTGTYDLYLQRTKDPANPVPISPGDYVNGTTVHPALLTTYTFSGTSGYPVYIRLKTSYDRALINLFAPNGTLLKSVTSGTVTDLTQNLTATGTYTLLVGDNDGRDTGTYDLYLQQTRDPGDPIAIGYGGYANGTISHSVVFDTYTFSATSGDPVYIRLHTSWPYSGQVKLYAPNGTLLASPEGYYGTTLTKTLPDTGTYTLLAGDVDGGDTGTYDLYLQRTKDPANPVAINYGDYVNGTTAHPALLTTYTFSGTSGYPVYIQLKTSYSNAQISLFAPNGTLLKSVTSGTVTDLTQNLTATGTYTLLIGDNDGRDTGTYDLYLQQTRDPGDPIAISYGDHVNGTIAHSVMFDTYTFRGASLDQISLELHTSWPYNGQVKLYAPNGTLLASSLGIYGTTLTKTLPDTGIYTVLVGDAGGSDTGTYSLSLTGVTREIIQVNRQYTSGISQGKWVYYVLETPAGVDLFVNVTPVSSSSDLEVYASYNTVPDQTTYDFGQTVKSASGSYDLLISPAKNGEYIIGIYGATVSDGAQFTIKASTDDKYVSRNYPEKTKNSAAKDIFIYGIGFENGMSVALLKDGSSVASAQRVIQSSSTMLVASFDLSAIPLDTYDVEVLWPDGTKRILSSSLEVIPLSAGALYEYPDIQVKSGIPVNYTITVSGCENLYVTLQKVQYSGDVHHNWQGTISLLRNGSVVKTDSGKQDQILHLVNPEDGEYTISVLSDSAGTGILTVWSALPELPEGNWVVDRIHRPYGSTFRQIEIAPGQDALTFDAEAMGSWSRFRVYHDQWGSSKQWLSSTGPDATLTISKPEYGLYVVEFMDTQMVSGDSQERDVMLRAATSTSDEPSPVYLPDVSGISPTIGGTTGPVTMEIEGAWLDPNATVTLDQASVPVVTAKSVNGSTDQRKLTAGFDLAGVPAGSYTVSVNNPDGTAVTASTPFTIEDGGRSNLWVEITGREKIRVGRSATYILQYGNNGSVDMPAPLIALILTPSSPNVLIRFNETDEGTPMTDGQVIIRATGPDDRPGILPAGSSYSKEIYVSCSDLNKFRLTAAPYGGDPVYTPRTIVSVIDAAVPSPGIPLTLSRSYPASYSSYLGPFGYGWVHTYDMYLDKFTDGSYGLMRGNAVVAILFLQDDGTYIADNGYPVLTRNGDKSSVLSFRDGSTIDFETNKRPFLFTDANGNKLTLTYSGDKITKIQHSDGDQFTFGYNTDDRITSLTDQNGDVTSYSYNAGSILLESVTAPDGTVTTYSYDTKSLAYSLDAVNSPGGITENFAYDGDGHLAISTLNGNKEAIALSYNEESRTTTIKDAAGSSVTLKVNENGQVTKTEDAAGSVQTFNYDDNNNLVQANDALGNTYRMTYDDKHNVMGLTDPLENTRSITYNSRNNMFDSVTDTRGNVINFSYDEKANLIEVTYPDGNSKSFFYDSVGNPIQIKTRNGDSILYQYTSRGLISKITYPDGTSAFYTYDTAGNLLAATNDEGTITFNYNDADQPVKITYPDGSSFTYCYDVSGLLTRRTESNGYATDYGYDSAANLVNVSDNVSGVIVKYGYDAAGRITRKDLRSGGYTTYSYNTVGKVSQLVNYNTTGAILSRFDYTYDAIGNPVAVDTLEGPYEYGYDEIGQLVSVKYPDGSSTEYTYDAAGNRVSVSDNGVITAYTTDDMDQYELAGDTTFAYDDNGNMVSKTEGGVITTYTYNYENRLVSVNSANGTQKFSYDALGNRAGVTVNGTLTRYSVDPLGIGSVVAEFAADGTLKARYTQGLGLVSKIDSSGNEYDYNFNPTGHTTEITDSSGIVVNQYQYAPFGEYRKKDESISNPFTYIGEFGVMDNGNDLYYMRMRDYYKKTGRFITEDPLLIPTLNKYSYSRNSPIKYTDITGLSYNQFEDDGKAIFESTLGALSEQKRGTLIKRGFRNIFGGKFYIGPIRFATNAVSVITSGCDWGNDVKILLTSNNEWDRTDAMNGILQHTFDFELAIFSVYVAVAFPGLALPLAVFSLGFYVGELLGDLAYHLFFESAASLDPEDKYGPPGYDPPDTPTANLKRFVTATGPLSYKVEFWNAENATANVMDVDAYDQLDPRLNTSTFGFTGVGFTNWSVPLDGAQSFDVYVDSRPEMDYIVHITGDLDPDTGNITLEYHTLDADTLEAPEDPVAGFLPPLSTNEYGWFTYTVKPQDGLPTGTVVENRGYVNFDYTQYFPAPKDAPWLNTLDAEEPTSALNGELVGTNMLNFTFSGSDDTGGSGVRDFTIYGSDNNAEYTPYLNHISERTATLYGTPGHTYRFFSIGRDNAGNTEPMKTSPEFTISIPIPPELSNVRFTATPLKGTAPLNVTFNDQSDNDPIAWNWEFGDNTNSTERNSTHVFTEAGNYTVNLTVTNAAGTSGISRSRYITVTSHSRAAEFGLTQDILINTTQDTLPDGFYNGRIQNLLSLTHLNDTTGTVLGNLSYRLQAEEISYVDWEEYAEWEQDSVSWSFPSGYSLAENEEFSVFSERAIQESARTNVSLTRSMNRTFFAEPGYQLVEANITFASQEFLSGWINLDVPFNATLVEATLVPGSVQTDIPFDYIDEGETMINLDINRSLTQAGVTYHLSAVYQVDPQGSSAQFVPMIHVGQVVYRNMSSAEAGQNVSMPAFLLPEGVSGASAEVNETVLWNLTEEHSIIVMLDGSEEAAYTPVANFTADFTSGAKPHTVQFADLSTGEITGFMWDFGDNTTSSEQNPSHTYTTAGKFTVNLTVSGPAGYDEEGKPDFITVTETAVLPLPGQTAAPTDLDNDGLYEDLNGNEELDFHDVVLYFRNMEWIESNEPALLFDYNGNDEIDFNDVQLLFRSI